MAASRKKNLLIIAIVVVLIMVVVLSLFVFLISPRLYTGKLEPINIGLYPSEYTSLIYIANDQKYFSANGLNVTFKTYLSGASAVSGMLKGEVDASTGSEFVVASNVMKNASLCAFGSVSKYLNVYLAARIDKGINSISDLEGKRIGITLESSNQFYLSRFLELNGINQSKVTLVNINFVETPNALANGTVDATVTFQPYLNQIQSFLPNKTVVFPIQSNQFGYFEATCAKSWASSHSDLIIKLLKALIQAESFNINHQDKAIAIVAKDLNYTDSYATSVWPDFQYSVTLDQSFVLLMQEEARWLISNNLTSLTSVPNFLTNIYSDGLKSVRPQSVNIIGLGN